MRSVFMRYMQIKTFYLLMLDIDELVELRYLYDYDSRGREN
jgi:hypothetical protein